MPVRWSAERWARLESLFVTVADLPPASRMAFLEAECAGDSELRRELISLLRYDTAGQAEIEAALGSGAASVVAGDPLEGRVLGAWKIEREIGRGGMSVVYLASRDDGEFRKRAAVKLIKRGMDTDAVLSRLRRERHILAALDHPYIARLLDGGTTPDGRPYIVMDYVEGLPIDRYCDERGLGVEDRCRLMTKVLESVAWAHRNLVIHRDLKPANILVTANGDPKLLDFGIAGLLETDDGEGALTRGQMHLRTPEYASPEQLNGQRVGTTADVYSLGVVLFEMLAGTRPNLSAARASTIAAAKGRDRQWQRALEGDLDTILQAALRPEPERRYHSAEQFESDLQRYLTRMPVKARGESLSYLCGKFLRRHRIAAAAAALAALSLTAGLGIALWEAHSADAARKLAESREQEAVRERSIARQEADRSAAAQRQAESAHSEADLQRLTADSQRLLAERRFDQVRNLAQKVLFDINDSISSLSGATAARKLAIDTGLHYYDALLKDAGGNRDLLEEIARGYDRLGDIQGNPYSSNLGDVPGAEASYRKAQAIRSQITDDSKSFALDRIQGDVRMGEILIGRNDDASAIAPLRDAIHLGSSFHGVENYEIQTNVYRAYSRIGDALANDGREGEALDAFTAMQAFRLQLSAEKPDPAGTDRDLTIVRMKLAGALRDVGSPGESVQPAGQSLAVLKKVAAADPANLTYERLLCIDYILAGDVIHAGAGTDVAPRSEIASHLHDCSARSDALVLADPENRRGLVDAIVMKTEYGDWLHNEGDIPAAAAAWTQGIAAARKLISLSTAGARGNERYLADIYQRAAVADLDASRFDEALANLRTADEYASQVETADPDSLMRILLRNRNSETRASVLMTQGQWQSAVVELNALIGGGEEIARRDPRNRSVVAQGADAYFHLARCFRELDQREAAVDALRKAVDRYAGVSSLRPLLAAEQENRTEGVARLAEWAGQ